MNESQFTDDELSSLVKQIRPVRAPSSLDSRVLSVKRPWRWAMVLWKGDPMPAVVVALVVLPGLVVWAIEARRGSSESSVVVGQPRMSGVPVVPVSLRSEVEAARQAFRADPVNGLEPLARIYTEVLVWTSERTSTVVVRFKDHGLEQEIRSELQTSRNPELIRSIARYVVDRAHENAGAAGQYNWDLSALKVIAIELAAHGQELEPDNPRWDALIETAKNLPVLMLEPLPVTPGFGGGNGVRSMDVTPAPDIVNLPALQGLEGTARIQIRIGVDGTVVDTKEMDGDPRLMAEAARVSKGWHYAPARLNGRPLEVIREVYVNFKSNTAAQSGAPKAAPKANGGLQPAPGSGDGPVSIARDSPGAAGVVRLRAQISLAGIVLDAGVIDGDYGLGQAAVRLVEGWYFEPPLINGQPAQVMRDIFLDFKATTIVVEFGPPSVVPKPTAAPRKKQ